jgi:hypothetical protein
MSVGMGFARFMERRGYRVLERAGALWHSVGFGMYISFPYHRRLDLDPREADTVLRSMRAVGIRYASLRWGGLPSGLYVCRSKDYDFQSLHRNHRAHIRKGLPFFEIRELTEGELLTQGLAVNRETLKRQSRYDAEFGSARRWARVVTAIQDSPCISAIGAFLDGRLGSYAITCVEDGWLQILHKMNSFEFDGLHASHVLDFTLTRRIATDPSLSAVSMGWASLAGSPGVHEYKIRLGYTFEPQSSVIRLAHSAERALDNSVARAALRFAGRMFPRAQFLGRVQATIEGARHTPHDARSPVPEPADRDLISRHS